MTMYISVPYSELTLTADEVARRLGLWGRFGKRDPNDRKKSLDYPEDERDPIIWLAEMYDEGYNMDVMEGIIIMGDEENENYEEIQ